MNAKSRARNPKNAFDQHWINKRAKSDMKNIQAKIQDKNTHLIAQYYWENLEGPE